MVKLKRIFWVFVLLLIACPQLASAAQVQAVADRDRISVEESLHLELRVNGSPDGDPDLKPLDQDWEVLSRSQSSQIQIINGDYNRSLVYSLALMPRREGELVIPAICFGSDCSAPVKIRVTAADQAQPGNDNAEVMLETEATPFQPYVQQEILLKVRLLRRVDLLQGSLSEPQPTGVDAVVQKLGDDRGYETRRGGRLYQVIERSYAIFPQTSGTMEIPPLRFDGEISRGVSRFDPFGGRGVRIRKHTDAIPIKVLAPPADRGSRNWLPARSLELQDDWQGKTLQLTVGEPATRTLTLTAKGLQAAQLPELRFDIPTEFKNYPDQPSRKDDTGADGITGVLQQKVALVPTKPGRYQLPAVDLDWWDVEAKTWRKAHLDPVDIEVKPAAEGAFVPPPVSPTPESQAAPAPASPPPSSQAAPPASMVQVPVAVQPGFWPWLSLALGLGWLVTLVLYWRQRGKVPRQSQDAGEDKTELREKAARQSVLQAAGKDDAAATRQALESWCRTLWPDTPAAGLERLAQTSPEMKTEIDRLNRVLYSSNGAQWSGRELGAAISQWDQQRHKRGAEQLPGLYPTATRSDK